MLYTALGLAVAVRVSKEEWEKGVREVIRGFKPLLEALKAYDKGVPVEVIKREILRVKG